MRIGFGEDEYNAGLDFCPNCGRSRRHLLRVRSFRIEAGPLHWHLFRRYRRVCTRCGYAEVLREPPAEWWDAAGEGPAPAVPGSSAGPDGDRPGVQAGMAGADETAVESPSDDGEPAGEFFPQLAARMDYLLAPVGARERQHLVTTATPGVAGIFLEHARREAAALVRQAMALREAARLDPQALERVLEEAVFAAAWEGYTAFAVLVRLRGGGPPQPARRSLDEFMRRVAPLAYKRAERGRAGTPAELTAWFWARRRQIDLRLQGAGFSLPVRLRPPLEQAARDAMYLGYAVAAEEGRFG